jgi:hypothetical protein
MSQATARPSDPKRPVLIEYVTFEGQRRYRKVWKHTAVRQKKFTR